MAMAKQIMCASTLAGALVLICQFGCPDTSSRRHVDRDDHRRTAVTRTEAWELAVAKAKAAGCNLEDYKIELSLKQQDWVAVFDRKAHTSTLGGDNIFLVTVKPDRTTRLSPGL